YGVKLFAGDEATVAAALGRRTARVEIMAALDDWSHQADNPYANPHLKQRLRKLADALETLTGSDLLARAAQAMQAQDAEELKRLASEAETHVPSPRVLYRLADDLYRIPATQTDAERLLRLGQHNYPGDFWLNHQLGYVLYTTGRAGEAVRYFSAAL